MLKLIEQLNAVQEHDRLVTRLRREQSELPARRAEVEARIEDRRAAMEKAEADRKQGASDLRQLEIEVESLREKIARFRRQQLEIKSNEEYRALVHEIEAHQRRIRETEDRELEQMEKNEASEAVVARCRNELAGEEGRIRSELAEMVTREQRVAEELARLEEERRGLIEDVDPEWLARYERILHHVGDFAVVPVENSSCGGCHMKLTAQVINDARRAQSVTSCVFCGRLLYWPG